jgi:branched-subunit amino acid transport protein
VTGEWLVVIGAGAVTVALKAAGPLFLSGRKLPAAAARAVELLTPAILAALVATQTFAFGSTLAFEARALGVAVAAVFVALRAPILVVVAAAAAVTALVRAIS